MKKLLFISAFLFSTSMMFGQFSINYSGNLTNQPSFGVMVFLEVDSVIVDSTFTNVSTGNYSNNLTVPTRPFMIRVLFTDCHGVQLADFYSPPQNQSVFQIAYDTMSYCSPMPCNASFNQFQATGPGGVPVPNQVILVDNSTGNNLSYSWNFGDGSGPQAGLNVSHTYATHGMYNVCLTVTSTTGSGVCTSVYCDTLTMDSTGVLRSSFTVTTGNSSLSVKEVNTISEIKLYPNPAQMQTILDVNALNAANLSIRIIDFKGAELQRIERGMNAGANKFEINTSNLEEGMYLIQLNDGKSMVTKRLQIIK